MSHPSLRPQDVVVLAKLLSCRGQRPRMARIGVDPGISASEVHAALKRLVLSRLTAHEADAGRPLRQAVEEFLLHGVKYAFPARRGEMTRGVPTSYAAPPLAGHIAFGSDLPPVWPYSEGKERGIGLEPLYRTVPSAALRDPVLSELLALIDALRDGRARERRLAEQELVARLHRQLHA